MIETLPQQPVQLQHLVHQQQQSFSCRQSAGIFQHAPPSPSPLGLRNANAIFPTMNARETEDNNLKFRGFTDQENSSANTSKLFSFSPTNNTTNHPPPKQSTFEARFRKSGGSNNPFTKIFGSSASSSSSDSNGNATKHRQLFLNKVKQNRDNARFNSRGETLMMMEYHSEQQSWDERMRRRADNIYQQDYLLEDEEEEEEQEIPDNGNGNYHDESALAQFLMQEEEQDRYVLSPTKSVRSDRSSFCGDDGDYDDIFMELVDDDGEYRQGDTTMSF
jgi:hypothetical protein